MSAKPTYEDLEQRLQALAKLEDQLEKAERELRASEERFRVTFQEAGIGMVIVDLDGRLMDSNRALQEMFGYSKEELAGRLFTDFSHAGDEAVDRELARQLFSGKRDVYQIERRYLRKDGQVIWGRLTASLVRDDNGEPDFGIGMIEDIGDRKNAEEALQASEERYRLLAVNSLDVIWTMNLDLKFTYINPAVFALTGYTPEEWIGSLLPEHCDEENFAKMAEVIATEMSKGKGGTGVVFEAEMIKKNREPLPVEIHGKMIYDDSGQPIALQGTTRDISERKAAERQLHDQNRFIRTILDNLPIGLAVNYLEEGTATYTNKRFEEIYGWPATEVRDVATFFEKVYPDARYRAKVKKRILADLASGDPNRMQWERIEVTGKDGSKRIVSAKNIPLFEQNVMISTVQDITERHAAEMALQESERRFRLLVESSPDAILVLTKERFAYLNQTAVRLFGAASADALVGRPFKDRIHPEFDLRLHERLRSLKKHKTPVLPVETVFLRIDGSPADVEVSAVPILFGDHDGALVFVRDISERIEREKAHRSLQEQLVQAQKMESVGRLAGGVAHDYNNMLSVIMGYAELALAKVAADDPLHGSLEGIMAAARRSTDITRQLLAFARQQTIAPRTVNLNRAVASMLKMLRRLIGEDIDLTWSPGEQLWPVKIDPVQIDQILANLSVNARDAIASVGRVGIATQNVTLDQAFCDDHVGFVPGKYVMLMVSDNGGGMDQETLAKAFEPFYTTKEVGKGTGLGLATVYGVIKQNNGFIDIESEPGQGTTIKIYLPRDKGKTAAVDKTRKAGVTPGRGETVLLVEDDVSILQLVSKILEDLGYNVLMAATPSEALKTAKAHDGSINLLISDVIMPEMNGSALAEKLTALCPKLKTLFMSGYTADVIAHRGVLQDGVNFIHKPFSKNDLAAKIRAVLEGFDLSSPNG